MTVKVPQKRSTVNGVNVTLTVQLAPTARELPQLLVSAKGLLAAMLEIAMVALPAFWSVTV